MRSSSIHEIAAATSETWHPVPTLGGGAYAGADTWAAEQQKVFGTEWINVAREEEAPEIGDYVVRRVGEESLLIVRAGDGALRAFFNVCAHRGTRLADGAGRFRSDVIVCPYHAWTYSTDGRLLGTPNISENEWFERSVHSLSPIALRSWQGFVFVSLAQAPEPLDEFFSRNPEGDPTVDTPRWQMADLRIGHRIVYEVAANWKIVCDNYNECLHCPTVHPELVKLVPEFRKGLTEGKHGAALAGEATTLTPNGASNRPPLPGLVPGDLHTYLGNYVYPTMMINLHSDCVMIYRLEPVDVAHTRIVSEFLFDPDTIARADFDPSDIVDFWDLVSRQDWAVCERAQLGMSSAAYSGGGVSPFNDRWIAAFKHRYQESMGGV